jgi:hypothetical protein
MLIVDGSPLELEPELELVLLFEEPLEPQALSARAAAAQLAREILDRRRGARRGRRTRDLTELRIVTLHF